MEGTEIRIANLSDLEPLELLINSAYRGESSKAGWTTEAHLLEGIRIDKDSLKELIQKPHSVILLGIQKDKIIACVNLQKGGDQLYLGMLTVSPAVQAQGLGKLLLNASETYAGKEGCASINMTVISVRSELINWYERRGYHLTGETKPFPSNNPKFGIPKCELEFVVMQKRLLPNV